MLLSVDEWDSCWVEHALDFVITMEDVSRDKVDSVRPAKFCKSDLVNEIRTTSLDSGVTADIGLSESKALIRLCI